MNSTKNKSELSNLIFDACFISMSELKTDARTLNIMRTLVKNGKKVCAIAFGNDDDVLKFKNENIYFFNIKVPKHEKALKIWFYFNKEINKILKNSTAKIYSAADFFSLKSAIKLKKLNKAKLFYDSREIYSAIGSLENFPLKQYIQTKLELSWVKNVDKVIVSGEMDKELLIDHFNLNIPFHVIMNLPPFREKVNSNIIREKFKIPPEKKIIIYQGMLIKGRGILPLVEALQYLDSVVFCLLGTGNYKNIIQNRAKQLGVEDKLIFCGYVPYDELHLWTSSADVGNCFIEPISICNTLALPNKLFEYCMAGIPSIVSDMPAMKNIVNEYKFAKLISADSNPKEISEALKNILEDDNLRYYKENAYKSSKIFNYEKQENLILEIFNIGLTL